ncbi:MAG: M48 family metalloprotease [Phycisphaeraceae bacterium]|nr:M48 family metalloprotease [Phycisphaeraceae bacterium]
MVFSALRVPVSFARPAAALTLLACCLGACSTNPTTGRSQLNMLSRSDEIQMGVDSKPEMLKEYGGEVKNSDARAYVSNLGHQLAAQTEADNPGLPWEFTLLDSDVINAFALPGGKVFVSKGLAIKMTNEAQLAGVLGHEIGHVTARHINDKITRQAGASVGLSIFSAVIGGGGDAISGLAGQAVQISLLSFDRDQENEADTLGMRYMVKIFYNPIGQLQVMEILKKEAGAPNQPEFLSTHPIPDTRIKRIRQLIDTEYKYTQNNPQYKLNEEQFKTQFLPKLAALQHKESLAAAGIGTRIEDDGNPFPLMPDWRMLGVAAAAH